MSEYAQTQRRFDKLKATFDKLIEQNSYKKLREENAKLKKDRKELFLKVQGLETLLEANERVLKSFQVSVPEEIKKQV